MDKFYKYCIKDLLINNFENELKICKKYLKYKKNNYDKYNNKINKIQRTKYKEY